jgi:hypothetical protein
MPRYQGRANLQCCNGAKLRLYNVTALKIRSVALLQRCEPKVLRHHALAAACTCNIEQSQYRDATTSAKSSKR